MENRNHNAERSRGAWGGKEKVTPEDIKSLWTVCVHVCKSEEKLCVVEPGLEPKQTACKWRTGDKERERGREIGRNLLRVG